MGITAARFHKDWILGYKYIGLVSMVYRLVMDQHGFGLASQ